MVKESLFLATAAPDSPLVVLPAQTNLWGQVMIGTDLVSISVYNHNGFIDIQPDQSLSISHADETFIVIRKGVGIVGSLLNQLNIAKVKV